MKKILLILGICFLIGLPATSGLSIPQLRSLGSDNKLSDADDDPPIWAAGNFSGDWGVNIWGHDWFSFGEFSGYYSTGFLQNSRLSFFQIEYKEEGNENGTFLEGLFFGPYLLGESTDMETGNTSYFVGIGGYNETSCEFRWRIMGLYGPTLYMRGTYEEF
jgi:hypothetical protein